MTTTDDQYAFLTERFPHLEFYRVQGVGSWYGVDEGGEVHMTACGPRGGVPDGIDLMDMIDQAPGAPEDDWA